MKTILAIDDQKNNLITIKALMDNHMPNCRVLTAMSGEEGITMALKELPDVILLDVIMPEMDGFETCRRLKKDELTKHIPVVMITAIRVDTESRIKGLNIGADAFLSKPIDTSEFIAQVNVMLRIKEAEDKLRAEKEDANENLNIRTQELLESENLLQTIFNDPNNFVGILGVDGSFIRANSAALTFIDSTNSKLQGMKFWETPWWTHSEELQEKLKSGIVRANKGEIIRFEANHINLIGKPLFVNFSIRPVRDSQKNIFRLIVEGNDITKRKRVEQIQKVLHNITNAVSTYNNVEKLIYLIKDELGTLIDTKNYYIALYDEETDSLTLPFMADEKDKYESFPAADTMTGYVIKTKKSLLATAAQQEELVKRGDIKFVGSRSKIWLGVPLILNTKVIGVLAVQSYTDENAYNQSDMEILEFISDQISISIDRTKSEQDLVLALEKATESDRLKSSFLATMSHELRTPLNSIIGFSDFITEDLSVEEIIDFVKTINESGLHLLNIVEDIFDITLIETGEIRIIKEDVKLQSVLNEVYEVIRVVQQKTKKENLDLNLLIHPQNKEILINTDASKLKQILINLLKNAVKFTSVGNIQYGFSVEKVVNQSMLKFFIKDTGIGIPQDKQDVIFHVFRQVEDTYTKSFGGAGVGLTISKKLIEFLGGKIWLESEEGKGTIFYFTLPYEGVELAEYTAESKIIEPEKGNLNDCKKKIVLIVEDDDSSYKYLNLVIEKLGYITHWAENGEVAVELCKKYGDIDLVLMDINMPVKNGYEATKEIKKLFPNLPIIAQTAYAMGGDMDKILEAGCDDYISKPIKRELLIEKIASIWKWENKFISQING